MKRSAFLTYGIITINLIIAIFMFGFISQSFTETLKFIGEFWLNFSVALLGLYGFGYFIGIKMEKYASKNSFYSIPVGILGLFCILILGIFTGSSVGFFEEGIHDAENWNELKNSLFDYYVTPMYLVIFFGCIPTTITGGVLGYLLKMD